ncbi:MAG: CHAT domain-containing protein [Bacteroidales bacterium]|nr:CHAT domain-containing protein [Bacteroidales bacterium]
MVLVSACSSPVVLLNTELHKADELHNNFQYEQAIEHYRKYIETSKGLGIYRNIEAEAAVCRKIAHDYCMLSQYSKAREYIAEAIQRDSAMNSVLKLIEDNRESGKIEFYAGNYKKSIEILEHTLNLSDEINLALKNTNKQSLADTYMSLAKVWLVMGEISKSQDYNTSALQIYKDIQDNTGQIEAYLNLAAINVDAGDIHFGITLAKNSIDLAKKSGLNIARQNQVMGDAYVSLGRLEEGLRYYFEALAEAEKIRILPLLTAIKISIGDIFRTIGDLDQANQYFNEALSVIEQDTVELQSLQSSINLRLDRFAQARDYFVQENSLTGAGISYLRLGELYLKNEMMDSALYHFRLAKAYFIKAGIGEGISNTYLQMGRVYVDKHENLLADLVLDSAGIHTRNPELIWNILYEKGRLNENLGQIDSAVRSYQQAIQIIETIRGNFSTREFRSTYLNDRIKVYDRLIKLLMDLGKIEESFHYSERARARLLLDIMGNRRINIREGSDNDLIKQEQDLHLKMVYLKKQLNDHPYRPEANTMERRATDILGRELELTQKEYEKVFNQLKLAKSKYTDLISVSPYKSEEIQASIDDKTVLLAYWIQEEKTIVWIVTGNDIKASEIMIDKRSMEQHVQHCRHNIISKNADGSKECLGKLYDLLMRPLTQYIMNYNTCVIIPHQSLHFIPFHALMDEQGRYLIENRNIFYVSSASVYIRKNDMPEHKDLSFLGMALGDKNLGSFTGLPGTTSEIKEIGRFFENKTLLFEDQITEDYFKEHASGYQIIHLATHAYFNADNPAYSYILLYPSDNEDGELTVQEIFGLSLKAECITLSACQTALGKITNGDDITGLSRAFNYAGVPGIIVSLWNVADESTAVLMSDFYRFRKNHSVEKAMALAQQKLMKQYEHPFYWAPFIYIGNGSLQ